MHNSIPPLSVLALKSADPDGRSICLCSENFYCGNFHNLTCYYHHLFCFVSSLSEMSNNVEYRQSATPKPYESALMPEGLTSEEYQFFTEERAATEERHAEAVGAHEDWKAAKAKEARLAKLKLDKEVRLEKLRVLKLEEERKAEEKRQEEERIRLEVEKAAKELKEREDAAEQKWIEDLEAEKEKEKEKEDEANELALVAAGAPVGKRRRF